MSGEEQMFLVDEEQADEDGETSVPWKKKSQRQAADPCEYLPVYNTIHRWDLHTTSELVSYFWSNIDVSVADKYLGDRIHKAILGAIGTNLYRQLLKTWGLLSQIKYRYW